MRSYIGRAVEVDANVIYLWSEAGRRDLGYYSQEPPGHRLSIEY